MIDVEFGDKIVLRDGEVGKLAGFMGRGRNALLVTLPPAANGNKRQRVIRARDIEMIIKGED